MYNRTTISALLTHHWVCREAQEWPLVPYFEMNALCIPGAPGAPTQQWFDQNDLLVMGGSGWARQCQPIEKHTAQLRVQFPLIDDILAMSPGNVVVAGGAIARLTILGYLGSSPDLDVFFHSMPYEQGEMVLKAFISRILKEYGMRAYVTRNSMVTTLYIGVTNGNPLRGAKYQFVHRVYPNKSCVIGGFDLDCSAVLYDGYDILGTPLFTFTLRTRALISDVSRLSTSHADRVRKYAKSYLISQIVFTAAPNTVMAQALDMSFSKVKSSNLWIGGASAWISGRSRVATYSISASASISWRMALWSITRGMTTLTASWRVRTPKCC